MQPPPELSSRLMFGLMLIFALILAGAVSLGHAILTWDPEKPFRDEQMLVLSSMAEDVPPSLTFSDSDHAFIISDPTEIREFLLLLIESDLVRYHHSHPEGGLSFQLSGQGQTYLLGVDSSQPDVYWLQVVAEGGAAQTVKLLHSQALTWW